MYSPLRASASSTTGAASSTTASGAASSTTGVASSTTASGSATLNLFANALNSSKVISPSDKFRQISFTIRSEPSEIASPTLPPAE